MYRRMVRIREFELAAIDLFKRGQVKGTIHAYIGQEASGVGVCMALRRDDLIAGTHRSHGHNIAKGTNTAKMMAEILGKQTGYCQGRGGSMHIAAFETGSLGALAVVGSGIPLAVGAGLGFKMQGKDSVAVPFTGDAGSNTGNWHESMNMAAIWKLPVVFVLENNHFGVSTRIEESVAIANLSLHAQAYGMPGVPVDGFDVLAVHVAARNRSRGARPARRRAHPARHQIVPHRRPLLRRTGSLPLPRRGGGVAQKGPDPALPPLADRERPSPGRRARCHRRGHEAELLDVVQFAKESPMPDPATAMDYIYA